MWAAEGQLTEAKRWNRAKLAAQARNYSLANSLVQGLTTLGPQGRLLIDVAQKPELLNQPSRFTPVNEAMSDVVSLGLRRLARQDPERAMALLDDYAQRMHFSRDEKVAIAREIGLTLARRYDPRALDLMTRYDPELRDNTVSEWRLRLLLRLGRWEDAYELTKRLPQDLASSNRWKYWQARSLELAQPNNPQIPLLYKNVARERDFYGFLAADRAQTPYQLNNKPLVLSPALVNKVRNTPGVQRAWNSMPAGRSSKAAASGTTSAVISPVTRWSPRHAWPTTCAGISRRFAPSARRSTGTIWISVSRWPTVTPWCAKPRCEACIRAGCSPSRARKARSWKTHVPVSAPAA